MARNISNKSQKCRSKLAATLPGDVIMTSHLLAAGKTETLIPVRTLDLSTNGAPQQTETMQKNDQQVAVYIPLTSGNHPCNITPHVLERNTTHHYLYQ